MALEVKTMDVLIIKSLQRCHKLLLNCLENTVIVRREGKGRRGGKGVGIGEGWRDISL